MLQPKRSQKSLLASLTASEMTSLLKSLNTEERAALLYRWDAWRRPSQAPPPDPWVGWLIDAGRGWGKTRTGAETVRHWVEQEGVTRIGIVSETAADNRDIIVEGESGLLNICPPWNMPNYEPSKRRLTWKNGAMAMLYDAREPGQLRGPQHEKLWFDELAKYRYAEQVFAMAMFGLRLGAKPQWIATTTPLPTPFFKGLLKDQKVHITKGRTVENLANLSPLFKQQVVDRYAGTRLGKQELDAELIDDVVGALWTRRGIEECRAVDMPKFKRIVVGVDPATTSKKTSNEHGIITVGLGVDGQGYVIDDVSGVMPPDQMARRALGCYARHQADAIVVETNNGGDWIPALISTINGNANIIDVRASRGKVVRAEPIAALYDQGRVHHVGVFPELEDQMTQFTREIAAGREDDQASPDRVDALVWGLTELFPDVVSVQKTALTYGKGHMRTGSWMGD
jgi:predicted phage terminase large subunit-like protein